MFFLFDKNISNTKLNDAIKKFNPNYVIIPNTTKFKFKFYTINYEIENYKIYITSTKKIKFNPELKLLLLTSGSTGPSKFVMLSKKSIKENINQICNYIKISKKDTTIINLPLCYSFALSIFNTHFTKGTKIILSENSVIEKNYWNDFKKFKVNCFYGVPQTFEILKKINIFKNYFVGLKFMAVAGGKINEDVLNFLQKS